MATTSVRIDAKFAGDKPMEVLADLISKREKFLKGETTEKAVIATTINVVTSIRAETQKAPIKATTDMFTVKDTGLISGWRRDRGSRKSYRCARERGGRWRDDIHPVNLMGPVYIPGEFGHVYEIKPLNDHMDFRMNLNADKKAWFVMCQSPQAAYDYGLARMERYLKKSSGMAKYALGVAQAKLSDRPMSSDVASGSRQMQLARSAAQVASAGGDGKFSMTVDDNLQYSELALVHGPASLDQATMKAANRTAAIINKLASPFALTKNIPTPFPEVAAKKR